MLFMTGYFFFLLLLFFISVIQFIFTAGVIHFTLALLLLLYQSGFTIGDIVVVMSWILCFLCWYGGHVWTISSLMPVK